MLSPHLIYLAFNKVRAVVGSIHRTCVDTSTEYILSTDTDWVWPPVNCLLSNSPPKQWDGRGLWELRWSNQILVFPRFPVRSSDKISFEGGFILAFDCDFIFVEKFSSITTIVKFSQLSKLNQLRADVVVPNQNWNCFSLDGIELNYLSMCVPVQTNYKLYDIKIISICQKVFPLLRKLERSSSEQQSVQLVMCVLENVNIDN